MTRQYARRVAEVRPSQLLWSSGVGALVDLPHFSVVIGGLDSWTPTWSIPIGEGRLLRAVQSVLGPRVEQLLGAPLREDADRSFDPFAPDAGVGVPTTPFPTWLRCPICQLLARADSGIFTLETDPFRMDRNRFVHQACPRSRGRAPHAVPARFLVACRAGHLDDFPWHRFVHRGASVCRGTLRFFETGTSLETANLWVKCDGCGSPARSLIDAAGSKGEQELPRCRGRHPHLGSFEECSEPLRMVLLGASNSWFPVTMSALAVPTTRDRLEQLVEDKWDVLETITTREVLPAVRTSLSRGGQLPGFESFDDEALWAAIEAQRARIEGRGSSETIDLKRPEWEVFVDPDPPEVDPDFLLTRPQRPVPGFENVITDVVQAERLREVNALIGFTRVEPPERSFDDSPPENQAPLSAAPPTWVPATEVRGEGIFLRLGEDALGEWAGREAVLQREGELLEGHRSWRGARQLDPESNFPGRLFVLLHTLSHALLRELALECGYSEASIRERIYASDADDESPMAGILLYTTAADSDGTLGGLVSLGEPERLSGLLRRALLRARLCSADPLCAEHEPSRDRSLHGAACHACSFVSETSCEFGNRYLDRALLVETLAHPGAALFRGEV